MESIGPNDPIRNVAEKHLSKIAPNAPVFNLAKAFTETGEAVLVMEDQKLVAVLTKIDLISFLAGGKS